MIKSEKDLCKECLNCKDKKCCELDIAYPLFIISKEKKQLPKINTKNPCVYYNENGLCDIYKIRPVDCQLFPFNIHKINKKFYWIIWKVPCNIVFKGNKEKYLSFFEKNIIPNFKEYLEEYSYFRYEELISKYNFEVLREIKL